MAQTTPSSGNQGGTHHIDNALGAMAETYTPECATPQTSMMGQGTSTNAEAK